MKKLLLCTTFIGLVSLPAFGQTSNTDQQDQAAQESNTPRVVSLSEWAYDDLYSSGWSVEEMFDETEVIGAGGEEIGDIENVLISSEGNILAVIAEVGGLWDIGDTHISVPWEAVSLSDGIERLEVPITEESIDDYSVFGDRGFFFADDADAVNAVNDDLETGARVFKATDLIGDYAYLTGDERYGYVSDLVFDNDGQLNAVLIDAGATGTPGRYAYPYYGYGYDWHPTMTRYNLPYDRDDITVIETFDYGLMESSAGAEDNPGDATDGAATGATK